MGPLGAGAEDRDALGGAVGLGWGGGGWGGAWAGRGWATAENHARTDARRCGVVGGREGEVRRAHEGGAEEEGLNVGEEAGCEDGQRGGLRAGSGEGGREGVLRAGWGEGEVAAGAGGIAREERWAGAEGRRAAAGRRAQGVCKED